MGCLSYLEQFESRSTVRVYRAAVKRFLQTLCKVKDYRIDESNLEEVAGKYLRARGGDAARIQEDVQVFAAAIKDMPPKTRRTYLAAVKIFLLENGVELPQLFWRRLHGRVKGSQPVSEEKVPSKADLRNVMMHLPAAGRALFLTLVSSGMRIGEALKLQLGDLELNRDPPLIRIRAEYTKTGEKRIVFITPEAAEAIRGWLKVRDEYLKAAALRSRHAKSVDDRRVFPFTSANARFMWRNALRKTGNGQVDPRTRRTLMHPHVLRKYFRSVVGSIAGVDAAEALMGHHSYLAEVYRKYPDPERFLGEAYRKAVGELQVFVEEHPDEARLRQVEERNRLLENLNMQLQTRLMQLENEHREFKQQTLREVAELKQLVESNFAPKKSLEPILARLTELEQMLRR